MLAAEFIRNARNYGMEVRIYGMHDRISFVGKDDDDDPWLESLREAIDIFDAAFPGDADASSN